MVIDLDTLANNVAQLADPDTGLESIARMYSDQNRVLLNEVGTTGYVEETFFESPTFPKGAHFNVTLWINTQDDPTDHIKVNRYHYWSEEGEGSGVSNSAFQVDGEGYYTYEFDAGSLKLSYLHHKNDPAKTFQVW